MVMVERWERASRRGLTEGERSRFHVGSRVMRGLCVIGRLKSSVRFNTQEVTRDFCHVS